MTISLWGLRYKESHWLRLREAYNPAVEPEVPEAADVDVLLLIPDNQNPNRFGWYRDKLYDSTGVPLKDIDYECYVWAKTAAGFAWIETTLENALAR